MVHCTLMVQATDIATGCPRDMRMAWAAVLAAAWLCTTVPPSAQAVANGAPEAPPAMAPQSHQVPTSQPETVRKLRRATEEQIQANRERTEEMGAVLRELDPSIRVLETPHYTVYSCWSPRSDAGLKRIVERVHRALCEQSDIPVAGGIYAGKCPIYILADGEQFAAFARRLHGDDVPAWAGAYQGQEGEFSWMVLQSLTDERRFIEVLVHEATHSFLGRYLTNRPVPRWANEGLAEMMAARMVPGCEASRHHANAAREVVTGRLDMSDTFDGFGVGSDRRVALHYGVAQSLVRFMVLKDRKAFVRYVTLVKGGAGDAQALQEAYGMTRRDLLQQWFHAAMKTNGAIGR